MSSEFWAGSFGDEYHVRNPRSITEIEKRKPMWLRISKAAGVGRPFGFGSVLEIGAGTGNNIAAMIDLNVPPWKTWATEPNDIARETLKNLIPPKQVMPDLVGVPDDFGLVFTSGVMIHVEPEELESFAEQMIARSRRHVVAIEYFSKEPRMVPYRGNTDRLWTRDYGAFLVDRFGLEPVACGFEWSRLTGLDDVVWWVLRK